METKTLDVLLVEDNPSDVELIRAYLVGRGTLSWASTLREALLLASSAHFDVALVDSSLPDAVELEAVEAIAALVRFPVILLTGTDSFEFADVAARRGAQGYLVKGQFDARALFRALVFATRSYQGYIRYRMLLARSPDPVLIVGNEGTVLLANPAAKVAFATPSLVGNDFGIPIVGGEAVELRLLSGATVEMRCVEVPWEDEKAQLVLLRDISMRVSAADALSTANDKLAELVQIDPLTGCLNRRGLESDLLRFVDTMRRNGESLAAVLFDCDDFKNVNTIAGYAGGDEALKLIARIVSGICRNKTDRIGRVGGDEFLLLLPNTRISEALVVSEKIRTAIAGASLPLSSANVVNGLTVSIGIVSLPPSTASLQEAVTLAESALLASKRGGKNRISGDSLAAVVLPEHDLRHVLAHPGLIRVFSHDIVNLSRQKDESCLGYELLMRGPTGSGFESPLDFFTAAKSENLLAAADLACLRRCLEQSKNLPQSSRMHVNVFPSTVLNTPLDELINILSMRGNANLVVELNEQEFIGAPEMMLPVRAALQEAGVLFALDDVGFGRSSLETLLLLEPDIVKIDRRLVDGISTNGATQRMFKRLLACLANLGVEIIAEGIECEEDAELALELGVKFAHGFLWGRPVEIEKHGSDDIYQIGRR